MIAPATTPNRTAIVSTLENWSGGQRDRDHPSLLARNQYALGTNVHIRDSGLIKQRDGRTVKTVAAGTVAQGAIFFEPLTGSAIVVVVSDGKVWKWTGSGTAWVRVGTLVLNNTTARVQLVILNKTLWIFGGSSDNDWSWDGIVSDFTDEGSGNLKPPKCDIACIQENRICAGNSTDPGADYVLFSDIDNGRGWDHQNGTVHLPTDGSEAVSGLAQYRKGQILAFTRNSCHIIDVAGASVNNFTRQTVDPEVGCIAPESLVVVGEDAFFLSTDRHIRTIKRTINDIAYGVSTPISYFNSNLMARITSAYASLATGVHYRNYYLLAVPVDGSTTNNSVIPLDLLNPIQTFGFQAPAMIGEWTNMSVQQWVVTHFSGVEELYYLGTDAKLYKMFDGTNDDGVNIPVTVNFLAESWENPRLDKTMHGAELQVINSQGLLKVNYAMDDGTMMNIVTRNISDSNVPFLPVLLPFTLGGNSVKTIPVPFYRIGRSRYWQLGIEFVGQQIEIKQVTLEAWIEGVKTR